MGINEFDNNHPVFGNIKEAIQTLVKQRYVPGFWSHNSFSIYFLSIYILYRQNGAPWDLFWFWSAALYLLIWRSDVLLQENPVLKPILVAQLAVYSLVVQVYS